MTLLMLIIRYILTQLTVIVTCSFNAFGVFVSILLVYRHSYTTQNLSIHLTFPTFSFIASVRSFTLHFFYFLSHPVHWARSEGQLFFCLGWFFKRYRFGNCFSCVILFLSVVTTCSVPETVVCNWIEISLPKVFLVVSSQKSVCYFAPCLK